MGLHPDEWIAAAFEWRRNPNGTITCVRANTFLKKSELQSSILPAAQKLAVAQGAVISLVAAPKPIPGTSYWLIVCAEGSLCAPAADAMAAQRKVGADSPALPHYLMIGDSISLGYFKGVEQQLAGKFQVIHSAGNSGNMNKISHDLDCFLSRVPPARSTTVDAAGRTSSQLWQPGRASVVTFNAGIHDLARGQEWLRGKPLLESGM